jgi:pimeloyl-ACP methyl ester carboxylesterase
LVRLGEKFRFSLGSSLRRLPFDRLSMRVSRLKASLEWLVATGANYSPGPGKRGCASLKHYTAEYCEWGIGPPLVLIPGLAGGYELLGPLARVLAERYRVISYQLRGEDDCFALRRRFGLLDLVSDLNEFLNWHCLEQPIVCGVSFGGVLALEFAARFPHRLRSLVVQGAGARFERTLLQQVAGFVLSRYPFPHDNPFVNQFFNLLFGSRQRPEGLFEFVTRQCWQTDQSVMAHRFHLLEQFDVTDRMAEIRVPALVLTGDRDLLVSRVSLQALYDGLPHARHISLTGCGHLAFATHPERLGREIGRFLDQQCSMA